MTQLKVYYNSGSITNADVIRIAFILLVRIPVQDVDRLAKYN